jgi:SLOG-like protein
VSYQEALGQRAIAISTSESPDMPPLGLSNEHLRDAMAEIARHLLALGARLVYGGDLRQHGFTELLFELVARHHRDADEGDSRTGVISYLAWPVHILKSAPEIETIVTDLAGTAELICLGLDGARLTAAHRRQLGMQQPTEAEWSQGLTAMRRTMLAETHARIVLGGRADRYKGAMPGIAEEAVLSLESKQPLFLMGGFGGCARDVAETLGLVAPWAGSRSAWPGRATFGTFSGVDLNNGLTLEENKTLARTPHVDQAIALILRGLSLVSRVGHNASPRPLGAQ